MSQDSQFYMYQLFQLPLEFTLEELETKYASFRKMFQPKPDDPPIIAIVYNTLEALYNNFVEVATNPDYEDEELEAKLWDVRRKPLETIFIYVTETGKPGKKLCAVPPKFSLLPDVLKLKPGVYEISCDPNFVPWCVVTLTKNLSRIRANVFKTVKDIQETFKRNRGTNVYPEVLADLICRSNLIMKGIKRNGSNAYTRPGGNCVTFGSTPNITTKSINV